MKCYKNKQLRMALNLVDDKKMRFLYFCLKIIDLDELSKF